MWRRSAMIVALLAALAFGCRGGGAASPDAGTRAPAYSGPMSDELKPIVEAALAAAARRTVRDLSTLQVASVEAVTWSDGSLGCPQPGMAYTMALVPGYRIRIQAGDELLDYHASARGYLVLCPAGSSVDPLPLESK